MTDAQLPCVEVLSGSQWPVVSWLQVCTAVVVVVGVAVVAKLRRCQRAAVVSVPGEPAIHAPQPAASQSAAAAPAAAAVPAATPKPKSVNYHFTRQCNYTCKFCFHTSTSRTHLPLEKAKEGLRLLRHAGMEKINFSGGEPLLIDDGEYLGQLCKYCTEELGLYVSIVTNGSLMTEEWIRQYAPVIDIIAVSCDSFDDGTNKKIGRWDTKNPARVHKDNLLVIADWCGKYDVKLKINTVVNRLNHLEDMCDAIQFLKPVRWKVFQCLEVEGENKRTATTKALRNASQLVVTSQEFDAFLLRHAAARPIAESNAVMRASYFLLDEQMRFLDCSGGGKKPSISILENLPLALTQTGFAEAEFLERQGDFYTRIQSVDAASTPASALAPRSTVAYEEEEQRAAAYGACSQSAVMGAADYGATQWQQQASYAPSASACNLASDW